MQKTKWAVIERKVGDKKKKKKKKKKSCQFHCFFYFRLSLSEFFNVACEVEYVSRPLKETGRNWCCGLHRRVSLTATWCFMQMSCCGLGLWFRVMVQGYGLGLWSRVRVTICWLEVGIRMNANLCFVLYANELLWVRAMVQGYGLGLGLGLGLRFVGQRQG